MLHGTCDGLFTFMAVRLLRSNGLGVLGGCGVLKWIGITKM